jgi:hypothetical protein
VGIRLFVAENFVATNVDVGIPTGWVISREGVLMFDAGMQPINTQLNDMIRKAIRTILFTLLSLPCNSDWMVG